MTKSRTPEAPASFVDHLAELRERLIVAFGAAAVASAVAYPFSGRLLDLILWPVRSAVESTYFFSPYEAFLIRFKVSVFFGFLFSLPVTLWQGWGFLRPALYESERAVLVSCFWASLALFLLGAAFAFFVVAPGAIAFFMGFGTGAVKPLVSVSRSVAFVSTLVLGFGAAFDLPIVVLGLVRVGLLTHDMLRRSRKAAVVANFILAAVLTPTTDIFTQLFLALPLCLLFEACVFAARFVQAGKRPLTSDPSNAILK